MPETVGQGVKFERIRRITGYLVGTLDRWNNGKQAEEADRVMHVAAPEGIGERLLRGTEQALAYEQGDKTQCIVLATPEGCSACDK